MFKAPARGPASPLVTAGGFVYGPPMRPRTTPAVPYVVLAHALLLALVVALVGACGVLEPVLEGQRETLERIEALEGQVTEAQRSAAAVEQAYAAGEITREEADAELANLRTTILDGLAAVREAMGKTADAIAGIDLTTLTTEGAKDLAPFLPSPWREILLLIASLGGGAAYTRHEANRVQRERDAARAIRGEPVGLAPAAPARVPPSGMNAELLARAERATMSGGPRHPM